MVLHRANVCTLRRAFGEDFQRQRAQPDIWIELPEIRTLKDKAREDGLWNLFLPEGSLLVELLNMRNANEYYANHCRWMQRPYVAWQNQRAEREVSALDLEGVPMRELRQRVR